MGIFDWIRRRPPSRTDLEPVFDRLAELGFMNYVAESSYDEVRDQILTSLEHGCIEGNWDDNCVSSDRRSYPADEEDLAEGQIPDCILLMRDVLEQEGVHFTTAEAGDRVGIYEVFIDGEGFPINDYTSADPGARDWALAMKRLLEIVNELLRRSGSNERLFGIYGGNDGRAMLLTLELHEYIRSLSLIDEKWMPYGPEQIDLTKY